jgi:hypothetical protein
MKIRINFVEEVLQIQLQRIPIEIQKKEIQWAKSSDTVVLQLDQWTEVQVEVPKGRHNITRRIETSWRMSLKNRGYMIPKIIEKEEEIKYG